MNKSEPNRGYLARNLDYSKAVGLNNGLIKIINRVTLLKRYPAWLVADLYGLLEKSNEILRPLQEYRDQLSADTK